MEEKNLRNIALICSLVGLTILFYVSTTSNSEVKIGEITIEDLGKNLKTCGEVANKRASNNHVFFDIRDKTGKYGWLFSTQQH